MLRDVQQSVVMHTDFASFTISTTLALHCSYAIGSAVWVTHARLGISYVGLRECSKFLKGSSSNKLKAWKDRVNISMRCLSASSFCLLLIGRCANDVSCVCRWLVLFGTVGNSAAWFCPEMSGCGLCGSSLGRISFWPWATSTSITSVWLEVLN